MGLMAWVLVVPGAGAMERPGEAVDRPPREGELTAAELGQWALAGIGGLELRADGAVRLSEGPGSRGVMLISPKPYPASVRLRYEVRALTEETVLVALLGLSNRRAGERLTMPAGYDGAIGWVLDETANYFFAFRNAPHGRRPFVRRNPAGEELQEHGRNVITGQEWHTVEAAREGARLWLEIDGVRVIDVTDPAPHGTGGHLALRIRGTAEGQASCLVRNVEVGY